MADMEFLNSRTGAEREVPDAISVSVSNGADSISMSPAEFMHNRSKYRGQSFTVFVESGGGAVFNSDWLVTGVYM
ncbi:hypothetical protein [Lacticaseibacillus nasuensis]|uniref:hypothetical protein n=1 Tax=Lacticaseibacillus nasuensis TaxID=944671 RepID=UPI000704A116|nr:hypothetical protein [Lacticaseibacillus nasuensis]